LTERTIEQRSEHYRIAPQEPGNPTEKIDEEENAMGKVAGKAVGKRVPKR